MFTIIIGIIIGIIIYLSIIYFISTFLPFVGKVVLNVLSIDSVLFLLILIFGLATINNYNKIAVHILVFLGITMEIALVVINIIAAYLIYKECKKEK